MFSAGSAASAWVDAVCAYVGNAQLARAGRARMGMWVQSVHVRCCPFAYVAYATLTRTL